MRPPPPLLVIVGPTAVGKTAVAVSLARTVPVEAVNADSRQVYRGMDIGTGKPSPEEQAGLRHHLLDVADPDEAFHAARFRREALEAMAGIRARGRLPVVVGGTGLWVRALVRGLRPAPPRDATLRAELEAFGRAHGPRALHGRLALLDPTAAARLHPNDRVRVVRAIEVRLRGAGTVEGPANGDWWAGPAPWRLLMMGLTRPRAILRRRIAERAQEMLARGMMEEVRRLLARGYEESLPAMGGIGYRQLCAVLRGRMAAPEALRLMIRDTARYARRQQTWFARDPEIRWLDVDAAGGIEGAARLIRERVAEEGLIE